MDLPRIELLEGGSSRPLPDLADPLTVSGKGLEDPPSSPVSLERTLLVVAQQIDHLFVDGHTTLL